MGRYFGLLFYPLFFALDRHLHCLFMELCYHFKAVNCSQITRMMYELHLCQAIVGLGIHLLHLPFLAYLLREDQELHPSEVCYCYSL